MVHISNAISPVPTDFILGITQLGAFNDPGDVDIDHGGQWSRSNLKQSVEIGYCISWPARGVT